MQGGEGVELQDRKEREGSRSSRMRGERAYTEHVQRAEGKIKGVLNKKRKIVTKLGEIA